MEWNTVERSTKTEIDARKNEKNKKGKLGLFMSDLIHNIPTTWKWVHKDLNESFISSTHLKILFENFGNWHKF